MLHYGLIGFPLTHSFSEKYFSEKFEKERINASYRNFEIESIEHIKELCTQNNLSGFNVTIPFKEKIIPYLDEVDIAAKAIGAVNCVKNFNGKLKGYNTDVIGFEKSFLDILPKEKKYSALIFGSGGSSKAVSCALPKHNIPFTIVSRKKDIHAIDYKLLDEKILSENNILINTTPVGMYPHVNDYLPLPYQYISHKHYAFDLVYNPIQTVFLQKCSSQNAFTKNGLEMLYIQADESYQIFTQMEMM